MGVLQIYRAKIHTNVKTTIVIEVIIIKDILFLVFTSCTFLSLYNKEKQKTHIGKETNSARKNLNSEK